MMRITQKLTFVFLSLLILSLCISCSSPQQKKGANNKSSANSKNQPSELTRMLNDIDKTYEALNKLAIEEKESSKAVQGKVSEDKPQEENKDNSGSQGEKGQAGKEKKEDTKKDKEEKIKEEWEKIEKLAEKIHRDWNTFEPKAEEENINSDAITNFENKLNGLSKSIKEKKSKDGLSDVNGLLKNASEFTAKYKEIVPPALYDVKYQFQQSYVDALKDDWEAASKQGKETLKTWDDAKSDLEKEDKDLAMKMEFSLKDLESSITAQDFNLTSIKVKVVSDNYKAFEKIYINKAAEEEKKKKS